MSISGPLRRSLRRVPDFRQLPSRELDAIIEHAIFKEYKAGEVLWRTGSRLDLVGIVQKGEIILERQINGIVVRSVKLRAGDVIQPQNFRADGHSSNLARAVSEVRFCVLRVDQIGFSHKKHIGSANRLFPTLRRVFPYVVWTVIISLITIMVSWQDISRVLSGLLFLGAEQANQPIPNHQRAVTLLNYAEAVDRSAAFAHNQEGFLWYQNNDLQGAEAAFARAIDIDQTSGPGLNNLAVTYFASGQVQQATASQEKAAEHNPDNAAVHYNLGFILMEQNFNLEAIREFKEASYINPTWVLPYLQMGFNYVQMRDFANAEKVASIAVKLDPKQESAYVILGIALYNQDRHQEALGSLENAIQLDPSDNIARFYKALVLIRLEEFDSALSILGQLLMSTGDPDQSSRISAEIETIHRSLQSHQAGDQ